MKPPTAKEHWRRLSVDLKHERHPFVCQSCGAQPLRALGAEDQPEPEEVGLERWQEHDQQDRPQPIIVVLCHDCAKRLIEPHERLYARLDKWAPALGAMRFCVTCFSRDGLHCLHPDSKENGGPGLGLTMPKPSTAHLYYGGGKGEWRNLWQGPVRECAGFRNFNRQLDDYLAREEKAFEWFDNLDA